MAAVQALEAGPGFGPETGEEVTGGGMGRSPSTPATWQTMGTIIDMSHFLREWFSSRLGLVSFPKHVLASFLRPSGCFAAVFVFALNLS